MRAAIGFRDHSGWAWAVAIGGSPTAPEVILRERVEFLRPTSPRQPYHAAQGRSLEAGRALVAQTELDASLGCATATAALSAQLHALGAEPLAAAVFISPSPVRAEFDAIMRAHTLLHAAEGDLYRELLAEAAAGVFPRVRRLIRRDLIATAAHELSLSPESISAHLGEMGRRVGTPWAADHKEAALAAWLALAGAQLGPGTATLSV